MIPIHNAAGHPSGAGWSRLVIHPDDLQEVAKGMFQAAALVSITHPDPSNLPLFDHLCTVGREKGFQHGATILLLIQLPDQESRVLALVRAAIALMGGRGEFFDALNLITSPETGRAQ